MTNIDAVAQAIFGRSRSKARDWDDLIEESRTYYRLLAQAAVDALQLTEQFTWSWQVGESPRGYGYLVDTREEAQAEADSYMDIVRRLVGPWVRVDE